MAPSNSPTRKLSLEVLARNRLLAQLTQEVQQRLLPLLEWISPPIRTVVYETDGPLPAVYFPLRAVYSVLSTMEDGATVEVATIGNEGLVGLAVFLEGESMPVTTIVQVAGESLRMNAVDFRTIINDGASGLRRLLLRYTQAVFSQMATAHDNGDLAEHAMSFGADQVVVKPFDRDAVLQMLQRVLKMRAARSGERRTQSGVLL